MCFSSLAANIYNISNLTWKQQQQCNTAGRSWGETLTAGVVSPPPLLSFLLSLALLTRAICMDCSIRRLDSRADETRDKEGKREKERGRGRKRRRRQTPAALQDNDTTPEDPDRTISSLSLSCFYLARPHTHACLMRLSCWEIGWSISFSPPFFLSVFLSVSPPSIKLLLLLLPLSVSPRHSVPFQSNSENYNPWIYRRM